MRTRCLGVCVCMYVCAYDGAFASDFGSDCGNISFNLYLYCLKIYLSVSRPSELTVCTFPPGARIDNWIIGSILSTQWPSLIKETQSEQEAGRGNCALPKPLWITK